MSLYQTSPYLMRSLFLGIASSTARGTDVMEGLPGVDTVEVLPGAKDHQ